MMAGKIDKVRTFQNAYQTRLCNKWFCGSISVLQTDICNAPALGEFCILHIELHVCDQLIHKANIKLE